MNKIVYLARHGQTEWNREKRFQGHHDIPLNEAGEMQAVALGDRLVGSGIEKIYSSPKKRAVKTAQIIAEKSNLNDGIEIVDDLREITHGIFDGLTLEEVYSRHDSVIEQWRNDRINIAPPEGESIMDCYKRSIPVFERIIADSGDKTILVVSHMVVIKSLLIYCLGAPLETFWRFDQGSTALNIVRFTDRGPIVELMNDISHISHLKE